jgi:hypothetical protein
VPFDRRDDEGPISDEAVMALMEAGDLVELLDYEDWRPEGVSDFDAIYDPEDAYY